MHDLEICAVSFYNDLFRKYIRDHTLCDLCGVVEDAIYYFQGRKFTIKRQVFNDTVRVFQPLSINLILLAMITGILKTIMSCSELSTDIYTLLNV